MSWQILFIIQKLDTHLHWTPLSIVGWMLSQRRTNFFFYWKKEKWVSTLKKLREENKLEVTNQHGHSLNTWQVSWRILPKEKVNQSFVEVMEKNEHDIPKIQTFTPSLSNDQKGRDVSLLECYCAKKRYKYFSSYPIQCFLQVAHGVK